MFVRSLKFVIIVDYVSAQVFVYALCSCIVAIQHIYTTGNTIICSDFGGGKLKGLANYPGAIMLRCNNA